MAADQFWSLFKISMRRRKFYKHMIMLIFFSRALMLTYDEDQITVDDAEISTKINTMERMMVEQRQLIMEQQRMINEQEELIH